MTPDEWSKVKAFFDEASELAAGEPRNRFVASIEPESARAEVMRLLSLHDAESAIFDRLQPDTKLVRSAAELRSFNSGDVIAGRFRIVRFIAEGGMGEVYEAQDEQLNERVAVKTLHWETSQDSSALARFRQEIQLARRVTSPNVCRIHDLWEHKSAGGRSTWFLTMEFLEGETLARRIERGGSIPVAEVLPLVQQMAAGLSAAHDAGIVHRDFKSSNVMLVPRAGGGERAVVTDFGLSRSFDVRTTATGAVMGTPAYMAPEQIEGGDLGPATDLYALGVVMYEMLSGMLPFRSSSPMALAVKKLRETPVPPSSVVAGVPAVWDQVVMRCMQYRMNDRFQTAASVMEAIETGRMPSLRASKDLEFRVPALWWKVALVMILVAAGVGYWVLGRDRGLTAKPEALSLYREGLARLHEAAPNRAQVLFERALSVDPEFVVARARLAQSLAELEMVDAARDELLKIGNQAVSDLRKRDQTLIEGIRAMALRDYPKAIRWFGEIASGASSEEAPEALLDLAKAQLSGTELAEAIKSCNRAIAAKKDSPGALLVRARAKSLAGDKDAAQLDLQSAAAFFDLHGSLDGILAVSVQRISGAMLKKNLNELETEVRSSLALVRPPFVNHYQEVRLRQLLAGVLRLKGRHEDAIREAEAAMEIAKRNGQFVLEVAIQNDLGNAKFAQFNYEGAEAHHRQAMNLASQYRLAYQEAKSQMELAGVLIRQQKVDEGKLLIARAGEYFRSRKFALEFRQIRDAQINAAIDSYRNQDALELAQSLLADAERSDNDIDRTNAYLKLGHLAIR